MRKDDEERGENADHDDDDDDDGPDGPQKREVMECVCERVIQSVRAKDGYKIKRCLQMFVILVFSYPKDMEIFCRRTLWTKMNV